MTNVAEPFERSNESWAPFMHAISSRFRREKRSRRLRRIAALALGLAALAGLGVGFARLAARSSAAPLMAMVPPSNEPVFQPDSGLVQPLPGGELAIRTGGRS